MSCIENLRNDLTKYGQEHLVQFWDKLCDAEKEELREELKVIDVEEVTTYFKRALQSLEEGQQKLDSRMKPIPSEAYGSVARSSADELKQYEDEGLRLVSEGKVGVLLMAGGMGTRLGVTYPKGMYDVGLPSHKSLFQIQAERIRRVQDLAFARTGRRGYITWYIMTSEHTVEPTLQFLRDRNYFGLDSSRVRLFEQGMLPCFSMDGRIILDTPSRIAKSPDGNGGLYRALRDSGVLDDIENRGITSLHAHSVDNILTKVADPVFIGYSSLKNADCGAKVVGKAYPTEALGVVCSVDGKYRVVEYSEITLHTAELRNEDGELTFSAGNICNHYFSADFLRRVATQHEKMLQLHVAKKKIPFVDKKGVSCKPEKPNGIKMEKFVFDVFEFTDNLVVWEVPREVEFSALKNTDAAEKDCPRTARQDMYTLHSQYVRQAGGKLLPGPDGSVVCEISPLLSYGGEDLADLVAGETFKSPLHLSGPGEQAVMTNGSTNGTIKVILNGTVNGSVNRTHNGTQNGTQNGTLNGTSNGIKKTIINGTTNGVH